MSSMQLLIFAYSKKMRVIAVLAITLLIVICFLDVSIKTFLISIFRVWNLLHQLGEEPCQADARYDVEEQTGIDVALTADRDEYLAGDRVAYEESGGDASHPL